MEIINIVLEKVSLIWQLLGENKESLQGLGSILNPLAIFTGSVLIQIWLNIQNKEKFKQEQKAADDRYEKQQQLTEEIAKRDEYAAIERLRKETLDSYLNRMTLLIEKRFGEQKNVVIIDQIARALTIATLRELDSERNKQITTFLYELNLIQKVDSLLNTRIPLLYKADLEKANLRGAFLKGADLREANLKGADLREANLENACLEDANLEGAFFEQANLKGAILSGATLNLAKLSNAILNNANLEKASLRGADLSNSSLHGTNLKEAQMRGCDLFQAEIVNAILTNADLRRAKLINTTLSNSDLSNTFFKWADFSLSKLTNVNLQSAYLRLIVFRDQVEIPAEKGSIKLRKGCSMTLATGTKLISGKAELEKVDLREATLDSADFSGAIFKEVDLRGAKYKEESSKPVFSEGFDESQISNIVTEE
ncbi:pentapeptide repeat-containing protein [Nostoc sp. UHCC 0870]|uniref:pentapeptide repeat-containing protein n=1 Tax=Nostoc sp. UHCC 0870 TaxID=2914041 RepID=UPI001EDF14E3|nr:pentapeptide repeat-containing protein [Nostoc sp. UHCC 0870]UKP01302.1 pentapeptide repeat-containing protein [Nostoc sp. UHCC 0870]